MKPKDQIPAHEGQLFREDIKPGVRFTWQYEHLPNPGPPSVYIIKSAPYDQDGSSAFDVERQGAEMGEGMERTSYLTDAGLEPYPHGLWNTNWLKRVD